MIILAMSKFSPFNITLNTSRTETVNGVLVGGHDIGINWPKGPHFHLFRSNIFISKDGIYQTLQQGCRNCNLGYFFLARLFALLEVLLYVVTWPFMVLTYLIFMVISLCAVICLLFTLPFSFPMCCTTFMGMGFATNRAGFVLFVFIFLESILSILYGVVYLITSPFQIIVPELTQLLLKQHTWGTKPFHYF